MKRWLRVWAFLLVAAASFAPAFAADRAIQAPTTVSVPTLAPLAQLGGLLNTSLPALAQQNLAVQSLSPAAGTPETVVPAALDVQKAQILMNRAAQIQSAPIAAQTQETQSDPRDVIKAVNATLKDFTPEALEKMPDSDLHELSTVIMDQLQGKQPSAGSRAAVLMAQARTDKMLAMRGQPLEETLMNPGHTDNHPDDISVRGVPKEARLVMPTAEPARQGGFRGGKAVAIEKDTVFRHYTTKEGFDAIMKSGGFWNGFVPYVQLSPSTFKKTFRDVSGLFFTLPKVSGASVGVPEREFDHYVDVMLPANLPLLELEVGGIYLVPLPGRTREWVREYYDKWTKGEAVPSMYHKMVAEMDAEGGPGPNLAVPASIVGHGKVR